MYSIRSILYWTFCASLLSLLLKYMGAGQGDFWNSCALAFWYFFFGIDELNKLMSTTRNGSVVLGVTAAYIFLCLSVIVGTIFAVKKLKVLS